MNRLAVLLVGFIAFSGFLSIVNGKIINCYHGSWAHYRLGEGKFTADKIDPNLCTHLSYSFYGINNDTGGIITLDSWLTEDGNLGHVSQVMKHKEKNPNFKVMLAIGGWNECETDKYSRMAASPTMRKNFVDSAVALMEKHNFDGLDMDWEYPVTRAGTPDDKQNFVTLLGEIKAAFKNKFPNKHLLLSVAVAAGIDTISKAYDVPGIAKHVDFINVMTYDFYTWVGNVVGFNSALDGPGANNIKSSIQYWMEKGAPASILVLGIPFYGHTFKLANADQYSEGSTSTDGLGKGPITGEKGFWGYNEICQVRNLFINEWSAESSVPFLHRGKHFVTYDNIKSIEAKVDYSNTMGLAGVMIWSIETDDFNGKCDDKKPFPLLRAINNRIANPAAQSMASPTDDQYYQPEDMTEVGDNWSPFEPLEGTAPAPGASEPAVVHAPGGAAIPDGDCKHGEFLSHPTDITKFFQCAYGIKHEHSCAQGTHFDISLPGCKY